MENFANPGQVLQKKKKYQNTVYKIVNTISYYYQIKKKTS